MSQVKGNFDSPTTVYVFKACCSSKKCCSNLVYLSLSVTFNPMEQHTLKNVSNCFTTSIYSYSYLETSGGQSLYQYLNEVHFFNTIVN
jgi:hypothetical protein